MYVDHVAHGPVGPRDCRATGLPIHMQTTVGHVGHGWSAGCRAGCNDGTLKERLQFMVSQEDVPRCNAKAIRHIPDNEVCKKHRVILMKEETNRSPLILMPHDADNKSV